MCPQCGHVHVGIAGSSFERRFAGLPLCRITPIMRLERAVRTGHSPSTQILLAAQVSFRRQHGRMTEKELDLFQLAAGTVAQSRACSSQVVWRDAFYFVSLAAPANDVPHDVLADAVTPDLARAADRPEYSTAGNACSRQPSVHRILDPLGHGNRSDAPTLAYEIHNCPVSLPRL